MISAVWLISTFIIVTCVATHNTRLLTRPSDQIHAAKNTDQIIQILRQQRFEYLFFSNSSVSFNVYVDAALKCKSLHQIHGYKILHNLLENKFIVWTTVTYDSYYKFFDAIFNCTYLDAHQQVKKMARVLEQKLSDSKVYHYDIEWIYTAYQQFQSCKSQSDIVERLQSRQTAQGEIAYYVIAAVKCSSLSDCDGLGILYNMAHNPYIDWSMLTPEQFEAIVKPLKSVTSKTDLLCKSVRTIGEQVANRAHRQKEEIARLCEDFCGDI
eukprot:452987_1